MNVDVGICYKVREKGWVNLSIREGEDLKFTLERQQNVWLADMTALEEDTRGRAGQVFQEKTA